MKDPNPAQLVSTFKRRLTIFCVFNYMLSLDIVAIQKLTLFSVEVNFFVSSYEILNLS